jgi:hypothetical protein
MGGWMAAGAMASVGHLHEFVCKVRPHEPSATRDQDALALQFITLHNRRVRLQAKRC